MQSKHTPGTLRAAHRIKVAFMPLATEEGLADIIAEETRDSDLLAAMRKIADFPCDGDGPRVWVMDMMRIARAAIARAEGK